MKVLMINGSPDSKGCIATALNLAAEVLNNEGIGTEIIHVGNKDIRGCIACMHCKQTGKCVFNDLVNETAPKLKEADGIVIGSPSVLRFITGCPTERCYPLCSGFSTAADAACI